MKVEPCPVDNDIVYADEQVKVEPVICDAGRPLFCILFSYIGLRLWYIYYWQGIRPNKGCVTPNMFDLMLWLIYNIHPQYILFMHTHLCFLCNWQG